MRPSSTKAQQHEHGAVCVRAVYEQREERSVGQEIKKGLYEILGVYLMMGSPIYRLPNPLMG